jgi:hypothetical protein
MAEETYFDRKEKREAEWAFACWRFSMWVKGYGSYTEIEEAVERGELEPFKEYPKREGE